MKSAWASICGVVVLALGVAIVSTPTAATAKAFTVMPGQSIQAAVDAASPGDRIVVEPGDYTETPTGPVAVHVTKSLKILGKRGRQPSDKVRILAAPGQAHGIVVEPANPGDPDIDGLVIKGFTVEGFEHNGIWLRHVNNFDIEHNESINNLEVGIFPVLSANGLVKKNVAYGSQDSALWVEGSQNVRVIANQLSNSPTGLEITISNEVTAERNDVHDNSVGVGLYSPASAGLPPDEWPSFFDDGQWHVNRNRVHDNNAANSAPAGSEQASLPYGGGILLLGLHDIDVQRNRVENNDFFGIAVLNYCIAVSQTPLNCTAVPPPTNPVPANDQFINNLLVNNHGAPPPYSQVGAFTYFASDILMLADFPDLTNPGVTPTTNCFSGNVIENTPPLQPLIIPSNYHGCP